MFSNDQWKTPFISTTETQFHFPILWLSHCNWILLRIHTYVQTETMTVHVTFDSKSMTYHLSHSHVLFDGEAAKVCEEK